MSNIIKKSLGFNLSVLKFLHLYSPEKTTCSYKVRAYVVYMFFMFHVPVLCALYFVLVEKLDMTRLIDLTSVIELSFYTTKLLPFVTKAEQIRQCIHYFESFEFVVCRRNQKRIIDECGYICKRNTIVFLVFLVGMLFSWSFQALFSPGHKLPLNVWFPVNFQEDARIYYCVYIWLSLGCWYPEIANAAVDPLIAGLACMASGHLRILKDNLQHIYEHAEEELENNKNKSLNETLVSSDVIFEKIQRCIKYHTGVVFFVKQYEECFSQVVFSQMASSIFLIGLCCFQLIVYEPFSYDFLIMSGGLIMFLVQIYFYCYYGTSLFEESNALLNAAYMSKWYNYDKRSKKALIILMERSKKPLKVTAGKILDLSLVTFITILRRAYSLLAVLKTMK